MKNLFLLIAIVLTVVSCKKSSADKNDQDPNKSLPKIQTYNNQEIIVGIGAPKTVDIDLDKDGTKDLRITDNLITNSNYLNTAQASIQGLNTQQYVNFVRLNPKLSFVIAADVTKIWDDQVKEVIVGDNPIMTNVSQALNIAQIDEKLNFSAKETTVLFYCKYFKATPHLERDQNNNVLYNNTILRPSEFYSGGTRELFASPDFGKWNIGYIGFRLMDKQGQPVYGWISVRLYIDKYDNLKTADYNTIRWYQLRTIIDGWGFWNVANRPIKPGQIE